MVRRPVGFNRWVNIDIPRLRSRVLVRISLASIATNAVLGIWALLVGDFGEIQGKVLVTSFLVSAAMLAILVNSSPINQRVLWPVPAVAAIASAGGLLLFEVMLWTEADEEYWWKLGGSALIVGAGGTLMGLLGLLALRPAHEPWRVADHVLTGVLCTTVIVVMWVEVEEDWGARVIGVMSVLVAALTLALPVLSRWLSPSESVDSVRALRFCPSCGKGLVGASFGDTSALCPSCGFRFTVTDRAGD